MKESKSRYGSPPFKYIYGPVESWRMGKSLGVDPLSDKFKICNLDCIYCQLGKTRFLSNQRKVYVKTEDIIREILRVNEEGIDYITFSGRGEPTLAKNFGEMIREIRKLRLEEIAVITNSTTMHLPEVRSDLRLADTVIAKLDACDELSFSRIDKPMCGISLEKTVMGLKKFRSGYSGHLALQIMFVEENKDIAWRIAELVRSINADEIQINTPLRPSAARPLDPEGIKKIKLCFKGTPAVTVYEMDRKETVPFCREDTMRRHGNFT